jgi:nucleotide-binding universal stress UspA family protein
MDGFIRAGERLLVPLDGSSIAERALPYAEALACAFGARLLLVRAAEARVVRVYLSGVAAHLRERGYEAETVAPYGDAGAAIVEAAERREVEFIQGGATGKAG